MEGVEGKFCSGVNSGARLPKMINLKSSAVCGGGWVMKNVSFVVVGRRICVTDSDSLVGIVVLRLL